MNVRIHKISMLYAVCCQLLASDIHSHIIKYFEVANETNFEFTFFMGKI